MRCRWTADDAPARVSRVFGGYEDYVMKTDLETHSGTRTAAPEATGRILAFALIVGLVLFSGASLVLDRGSRGNDTLAAEFARWYPIVLAAAGVIIVPLVFLLPGRLAASVRKRRDEALEEIRAGKIPFEVFRGYLVALALAEGWGLLGVAMHHLTREPLSLVAPGVAVLLMLANIPSLEKARRAVE